MSFLEFHGFFRDLNRTEAETFAFRNCVPVIRKSSMLDHYALTFIQNGRVIHILMRPYANGRIDCVNEYGTLYSSFPSLTHLLRCCVDTTPVGAIAIPVSTPDPISFQTPAPPMVTSYGADDPV